MAGSVSDKWNEITKEELVEELQGLFYDFKEVLLSAYCQCDWPYSMDEVGKLLKELGR